MSLEGVVVNGAIVLAGNLTLPEGARVRVDLADEDDWDELPPPTDSFAGHPAELRESIAEARAGVGGVGARRFL